LQHAVGYINESAGKLVKALASLEMGLNFHSLIVWKFSHPFLPALFYLPTFISPKTLELKKQNMLVFKFQTGSRSLKKVFSGLSGGKTNIKSMSASGGSSSLKMNLSGFDFFVTLTSYYFLEQLFCL